MRHFFLFLIPILIIVVGGIVVVGLVQTKLAETRLTEEVTRKARAVSESLELSAQDILQHNNLILARLMVESFQTRERLQGCIIYDDRLHIIAITSRISDWKKQGKTHLAPAFVYGRGNGSFGMLDNYPVYSYVQPVRDQHNKKIGFLEVIYDLSYIKTTIGASWKKISIYLIILTLLLTAITLLLHRRIFLQPINQLTQWFFLFQKGEIDSSHPIKRKGIFGKFASEVEQVALNLRIERKIVTENAAERISSTELWTEGKLRDLVQARLGENTLIVVSNREPFMHVADEQTGGIKCVRPASGVVTAIDPILRACGGTWIAHGSAPEDRKVVNSKDKVGVPPDDIRYILKRVWLTKKEEDGYYYGFSNEGLWPLCHITYTRPVFKEKDWLMYKQANQKFADSVLEELPKKNPFVFIQDYHFTLIAGMIKKERPDATCVLFWHIPWPNAEVFSTCPYHKEILNGMLSYDLIGFHIQAFCNNFFETANRLVESRIDTEKFSVVKEERETIVKPFPISVDGHLEQSDVQREELQTQVDRIIRDLRIGDKIVMVGVERIDYTKGLVERMLAIDRFLEKYPEYKEKFVMIQLAAPSRTHIKSYTDLINRLDAQIKKINARHGTGTWEPILYFKRQFSPEEILPYYHLSRFCIVSSLHDGMNLVAKEYIAAKDDLGGMLILSRFTGASKELPEAVLINPYAIEEFADSIKYAFEMPEDERKRRMEIMRNNIKENNVYRWAGNIITEMTNIKKPEGNNPGL
jgi:trehalose-6-phosphate synthase